VCGFSCLFISIRCTYPQGRPLLLLSAALGTARRQRFPIGTTEHSFDRGGMQCDNIRRFPMRLHDAPPRGRSSAGTGTGDRPIGAGPVPLKEFRAHHVGGEFRALGLVTANDKHIRGFLTHDDYSSFGLFLAHFDIFLSFDFFGTAVRICEFTFL